MRNGGKSRARTLLYRSSRTPVTHTATLLPPAGHVTLRQAGAELAGASERACARTLLRVDVTTTRARACSGSLPASFSFQTSNLSRTHLAESVCACVDRGGWGLRCMT